MWSLLIFSTIITVALATGCQTPLIADGKAQLKCPRTAGGYSCQDAKLNSNLGQGSWCGRITPDKPNLFVQVTLPELHYLREISTQGNGKIGYYVKEYEVAYTHPTTNNIVYIQNPDRSKKIFKANKDGSSIAINKIDIRTKNLYLLIKSASPADLACLRIEVYGCKTLCNNPLVAGGNARLQCSTTASGYDCQHAKLNTVLGGGSWCGRILPGNSIIYVQLIFPEVYKLKKISTQGNGKNGNHVKEFQVSYVEPSANIIKFIRLPGVLAAKKTFIANSDGNSIVHNSIDIKTKSLYVLITKTTPADFACLRLEVYGCKSG